MNPKIPVALKNIAHLLHIHQEVIALLAEDEIVDRDIINKAITARIVAVVEEAFKEDTP